MPPRLSIIIPTFNRSELFAETAACLAGQSFADWEAIVVDDGSEDTHLARIRSLCAEDERLHFFRRESPTKGAPVCRNEGLARARAPLVMFFDSDDVLDKHAVGDRVAGMEAHPETDFGVFQCVLFREQPGDTDLLLNVTTYEDDLVMLLRHDCPWCVLQPVYRREALDRLGPWDESLASWQDWDLHIRALIVGLSYRRFAGGVAFCRRPINGHESIGRTAFTEKHLVSHVKLLDKIERLLRDAGKWNEKISAALGGLYFWHAWAWAQLGRIDKGKALWREARRRSLAGGLAHAAGYPYLYLVRLLGVSGIVPRGYRKAIRLLWPQLYYGIPSPTFMRTPRNAETKYPPFPGRT